MFKQFVFAAAVLAFPTTKAMAQFASADPSSLGSTQSTPQAPTELLLGCGV